jgi:hypothetical protein
MNSAEVKQQSLRNSGLNHPSNSEPRFLASQRACSSASLASHTNATSGNGQQ